MRQIKFQMEQGRSQMTVKELATLTMVFAGIAANPMSQEALAAGAGDGWELKQLQDPSLSLKKMERAGRVTIYDGMFDSEVDHAMDRQFDRIESMMFIRTKHPVAEGTYETDDDC